MTPPDASPPPKVSVALWTYNQERTLAQALDSALTQETRFGVEIVAGDDASTDDTREILDRAQRDHPGRVRIVLHEQRGGVAANFMSVLGACRGRYVAFLEGDDYWTSRDKLQKEADFLDAHPECVSCFHQVQVVFEDGRRPPMLYPARIRRPVFSMDDILQSNFMATCSVMTRHGLLNPLPAWFGEFTMLDWPYHILHAQHGGIGAVPGVMAVYRVHAAGAWSGTSMVRKTHEAVKILERLNRELGCRYDERIRSTIADADCALAMAHARLGERRQAFEHARAYSASLWRRRTLNLPALAAMWGVVFVPALYRLVLPRKPLWR